MMGRFDAATALRKHGYPDACYVTVGYLVRQCCRTDLAGIRATANLVRMPKPLWPHLLPEVFAAQPNVAGWQLAMTGGWVGSSSSMVMVVKDDRETLAAWFEHANFARLRLPYLGTIINPAPEEVQTLYRGGQGDPEQLRLGYSWTPHLWEAWHYAFQRISRPGPPVILKRTVRRDEIAMQLRYPGGEAVVLTPHYDEVLGVSETESKLLAQQHREYWAAVGEWHDGLLRMTEADVLAGYCDE